MKLTALSTCLVLTATHASALCNGPSFLDSLTPEQTARIAAAVDDMPFAEGLVWQATKDARTLTVIGTMHINAPVLTDLRAIAAPYVAAADLLLVEGTSEDEQALIAKLTAEPDLYLITDGPTLPDLLDAELWARVQEAAAARQMPGFMIAQFEPWYLGLTLAIPPCATAALLGDAPGLDDMLIADAEAADVPIMALEPFDTIITALRDPSLEVQIEGLAAGLPPLDMQDSLFRGMLDSYEAGATAEMLAMSDVALDFVSGISPERAQELLDETEKAILTDRNIAWIPVIEASAASHATVAVAFGAAHLPGDQGVLNLLAEAGWAITRLD